jgi:hypothetical protein
MTLRIILPAMAAIAAMLGGVPATAQERPASIRQQLIEIRAMREVSEACNKGKQCLVSQGDARAEPQAPPGLPPVSPVIPVAPAPPSRPIPPPVAEPVVAPVPVVASVVSTTPASKLGGPITLAEAQEEQSVPAPFQPNSSLFGGEGTNVRIEADYQGGPDKSHSKASVTLAPKGQPFLVQVTGDQTTGDCPAGPGGSCEYVSRKLDVYPALRGWFPRGNPTTEWNVGPFVRFQQNNANGTWKSLDGLYSGKWKVGEDQTDIGIRARLRHRLDPKSSANPWIGAGGEYDFANGGYNIFAEGSLRPGNPKNPWNFYAEGGVNSDGGYAYPEITTPNLIGGANAKLQVQLQAKGVFYALGRENTSSQLKIGVPLTLNVSRNTAIQAGPEYVFGLDSNTRSGFGGSVKIHFGL